MTFGRREQIATEQIRYTDMTEEQLSAIEYSIAIGIKVCDAEDITATEALQNTLIKTNSAKNRTELTLTCKESAFLFVTLSHFEEDTKTIIARIKENTWHGSNKETKELEGLLEATSQLLDKIKTSLKRANIEVADFYPALPSHCALCGKKIQSST
ncbi:MAG: hypothetical protein FWD49_07135 [Firmicutes bacterium]|nr:hypothetical protein [Bacillota bacterium]